MRFVLCMKAMGVNKYLRQINFRANPMRHSINLVDAAGGVLLHFNLVLVLFPGKLLFESSPLCSVNKNWMSCTGSRGSVDSVALL